MLMFAIRETQYICRLINCNQGKAQNPKLQMIPQTDSLYYLNQDFRLSMASKIVIENIVVKNTSATFVDPLGFEVTFTCVQPISSPLLWKIIYVGSAVNEDCDQVLEQFQIPPISTSSTLKFEIQSQPPIASKIPREQLLCVTALILTASYKDKEFIRVGYYVHNQYIRDSNEMEVEDQNDIPTSQLIKRINRTIICDKPRVTKFNIDWQDKPQKKKYQEQSQSRLDDYFSVSSHSKKQEEDSNSQKMPEKPLSTHLQSEPINIE